jgi:hypothetical protein
MFDDDGNKFNYFYTDLKVRMGRDYYTIEHLLNPLYNYKYLYTYMYIYKYTYIYIYTYVYIYI